MINKTYGNKEPAAVHAYEVTPDLLREWANRLDTKEVTPGQVVRLQVAQDVELFYKPTIATVPYESTLPIQS